MSGYRPQNPDFAERVKESFARQSFMGFLDARLALVEPGAVDIELAHRPELCQQHGLFHGGVVGTLADNAGGYASFSLMRAEDSVLTIEYKLNLMAPALGEKLIARGRVVRAGRRLTVGRSDVYAVSGDEEIHCASMLGTFMTMQGVSDSKLEPADG